MVMVEGDVGCGGWDRQREWICWIYLHLLRGCVAYIYMYGRRMHTSILFHAAIGPA